MRFRLSRPAELDLEQILTASRERWGDEAATRYARVLAAALRQVAADPEGPLTRDRNELLPGIRSLHLRHVRQPHRSAAVARPVHIVYYRAVDRDVIEIVRVLHERMEPGRHLHPA